MFRRKCLSRMCQTGSVVSSFDVCKLTFPQPPPVHQGSPDVGILNVGS
ncbi:unnamed protein product, partial [Allacma fusca]